jgi:hypothetical protein
MAVRLVLVAALVLAALAAAAPARAATAGELMGFADRVAAVWAGRQDERGFFLDPRTGAPVEGYGNAMLGYALLRAGERAGDDRLAGAGVRAIGTTLDEPPEVRGVFDLLAVASAYNFARERLARDPSFVAERARWEEYLRGTVEPNIDNEVYDCIVSPSCFHNHEAVGATAALELLATGLESTQPGARLADPEALRSAALAEVGEAEPSFAQGDASWSGQEGELTGLALLSDTGNQPLAYHALSTAMFARSVELLGDAAPEPARAALRRTVGALAGFMAPDGAVAYIGKRQETLWSLAGAVAAAQVAIRAAGADPAARERYRAVADRALARIRARYPLTPRGLPIVPRAGRDAFAPDGVDGDPMTFNALALFLLNVAADAAPDEDEDEGDAARPAGGEGAPDGSGGDGGAAALPADGDGAFVDRTQNGFAAVRRGDVWFAVHRRHPPRDVRNDFGLIAAKWRAPDGGWVDVLRPRPMRFDVAESAGPVVERGGERLVPLEGTLAVGPAGEVAVRAPLGDDRVTYRFAPVERGVRISLPARAGDVVTYTAYLPEREARVRGGSVADGATVVTASPRPDSIRLESGFASCCDARMVAARIRVPVREDGTVAFTVAARAPAPGAAATSGEGGIPWGLPAGAAVAAAAAALVLRRRAVVGRRRRTRARRRR